MKTLIAGTKRTKRVTAIHRASRRVKASIKKAKRRSFNYLLIAKLCLTRKGGDWQYTHREIARKIRIDPHSFRNVLSRMYKGYRGSDGEVIKLKRRVSEDIVRIARKVGKLAQASPAVLRAARAARKQITTVKMRRQIRAAKVRRLKVQKRVKTLKIQKRPVAKTKKVIRMKTKLKLPTAAVKPVVETATKAAPTIEKTAAKTKSAVVVKTAVAAKIPAATTATAAATPSAPPAVAEKKVA